MKRKSKVLLCKSCLHYNRVDERCMKGEEVDGRNTCDLYLPKCLGCKYYNFESTICQQRQKSIDIGTIKETWKEPCGTYLKAEARVIDRYHVADETYIAVLGLAMLLLIPLTISYFISPIVSAIVLGIMGTFLFFGLIGVWMGVNENYQRGLRSSGYGYRFVAGLILVILAALIQTLFVYEIIPLAYLSWIFFGFGLFLALPSRINIDIRQVEAGELVEEIETIAPASPEETKELVRKPFGMDISMSEKGKKVGMYIVMRVFVVNNTDEQRNVDLKYVSPCFDPQSDSVALLMESKSRKKIKFIVHLRAAGDYVVSARLSDPQGLVAGVNRQLSIKSRMMPSLGISGLAGALAGVGGIAVALIELLPYIVGLF